MAGFPIRFAPGPAAGPPSGPPIRIRWLEGTFASCSPKALFPWYPLVVVIPPSPIVTSTMDSIRQVEKDRVPAATTFVVVAVVAALVVFSLLR